MKIQSHKTLFKSVCWVFECSSQWWDMRFIRLYDEETYQGEKHKAVVYIFLFSQCSQLTCRPGFSLPSIYQSPSLHEPINSSPGTNVPPPPPVVIFSLYSSSNFFFLCWEFAICPLYTCSQHSTMIYSQKPNLWNSIGARCDKKRRKQVEKE